MRPLFLIQSHKDPLHLARLVRTIRKGCANSVVLISHDYRSPPLSSADFDNDPDVYITRGQGGRGDFAIIDGYLSAIRWLKDNKIEYDWLTNLSGQDYPVWPLASFSKALLHAQHDGFLHHFDVLKQDPAEMSPMSWPPGHGYDRYYFQYRKLKETLGVAERAVLRIPRVAAERFSTPWKINTAYGLLLGTKARKTPFTPAFRCFAGSYWHTIRRQCAEYLVEFSETSRDITDYFRKVLIPDECFAQTVLVNHSKFKFENHNRRYFNMSGSRRGHPKTLGPDDVLKFSNGDYFFARKFEPSSGHELFDKLDEIALRGS